MDKGFFSKNFLAVISDSLTLAQVFVVILFFENYLISFQQASLFDLTIDLDSIDLAPFIWFFVFIAGFKVLWWIFYSLKSLANISIEDFDLNSRVHFTIFLLVILSGTYLHNIADSEVSLSPISPEQHPVLFFFYKLIPSAVCVAGLFIILLAELKAEQID